MPAPSRKVISDPEVQVARISSAKVPDKLSELLGQKPKSTYTNIVQQQQQQQQHSTYLHQQKVFIPTFHINN